MLAADLCRTVLVGGVAIVIIVGGSRIVTARLTVGRSESDCAFVGAAAAAGESATYTAPSFECRGLSLLTAPRWHGNCQSRTPIHLFPPYVANWLRILFSIFSNLSNWLRSQLPIHFFPPKKGLTEWLVIGGGGSLK